jgi:hypothetical protein
MASQSHGYGVRNRQLKCNGYGVAGQLLWCSKGREGPGEDGLCEDGDDDHDGGGDGDGDSDVDNQSERRW